MRNSDFGMGNAELRMEHSLQRSDYGLRNSELSVWTQITEVGMRIAEFGIQELAMKYRH